MDRYIVAAEKSWHREFFAERIASLGGLWTYVARREDLTPELVARVAPRYVFFPHWSHIVPDSILAQTECVCFHMTDLPYGRGGSPLQNLIVRGHETTRLTALRMTGELDAGPIYEKRALSLHGSAEQIFRRAAALTWDMIADMIERTPEPVAQKGAVTLFHRRKPEDGDLAQVDTLAAVYDYIRMLDAEGYPPAFLRTGDLVFEFGAAELTDDEIAAKVRIRRVRDPQ